MVPLTFDDVLGCARMLMTAMRDLLGAVEAQEGLPAAPALVPLRQAQLLGGLALAIADDQLTAVEAAQGPPLIDLDGMIRVTQEELAAIICDMRAMLAHAEELYAQRWGPLGGEDPC